MGAGVKGWIKGVFEFQSVLHLAWKMWAEHATAILLNSNKSFEIDCLFCVGRMGLNVVIASFVKFCNSSSNYVLFCSCRSMTLAHIKESESATRDYTRRTRSIALEIGTFFHRLSWHTPS